jgi:glutathione S-transferase
LLDLRLKGRAWLETDQPTVADIACYPYVSRGADAGIAMSNYPSLQAWFARIEALKGFVTLEFRAPGA